MQNSRGFSLLLGSLRVGSYIFTSVCLLLVLTNLVASWVLASRDLRKGADSYPPYMHKSLEVLYPDFTKAERDQLMLERMPGTMPEVLAQPREAPISGDYVNVHANGFRIGTNQGPWPPSDEFFNIFIFGSSTSFGYGVPDADTISSNLQVQLAQLDLPREPRTYNFARLAFYSTPERLLFSKLLAMGKPPDLAIFVDGMGEFFMQSEPSPWTVITTTGVTGNLANPWKTAFGTLAMVRLERSRKVGNPGAFFTVLARLAHHPFAPLDDPTMQERVIKRYVANKRIIEALASAYDVQTAFVWQPTPTYKYNLAFHLFKGDFGHHQASGNGYPRMAKFVREHPLGDNFLWCADIQEGVRELLYVDSVHYSPRMAARVAGCITDFLVERALLPAVVDPETSLDSDDDSDSNRPLGLVRHSAD